MSNLRLLNKLARITEKILVYIWWINSKNIDDPLIYKLSIEAALAIGVKPFKKLKLCKKYLMINAATIGCKSIVLTEALLKLLSVNEIKAVFLHEYAHCKLKHHAKLLSLSIIIFLGLILPTIFTLSNIVEDNLFVIIAIPIISLIYLSTTIIIKFITRKFELEADRLAVSILKDLDIYIELLKKIEKYNKDNSHIPSIFRSHPTVSKRIANIKMYGVR